MKNERFRKLLIFRSFSLFRSFWESKRAITLFVALFERAKEPSLFSSLFLKERKKSDRSFALLQRGMKRAITLIKRANERAIAQSLFWKERKWAMSEWANERLPNPAARLGHLLILKMSDRSFFQIAHFSPIFAFCTLFERANERSLFSSLFMKEWKSDCSFRRSFEKSDRSFALLQRATKRAITRSLF